MGHLCRQFNRVVTLANNEIVDQIQLDKYGEDTFLYNNLVPEDELSTIDLLRPTNCNLGALDG